MENRPYQILASPRQWSPAAGGMHQALWWVDLPEHLIATLSWVLRMPMTTCLHLRSSTGMFHSLLPSESVSPDSGIILQPWPSFSSTLSFRLFPFQNRNIDNAKLKIYVKIKTKWVKYLYDNIQQGVSAHGLKLRKEIFLLCSSDIFNIQMNFFRSSTIMADLDDSLTILRIN